MTLPAMWSWDKPGLDRTGIYRATFGGPVHFDPEEPDGRCTARLSFEAGTRAEAERVLLALDEFLQKEAGLDDVGEAQGHDLAAPAGGPGGPGDPAGRPDHEERDVSGREVLLHAEHPDVVA